MFYVECKQCKNAYNIRNWPDKEDLKGTNFESRIETITNDELEELYKKGVFVTPEDIFAENPQCLICGTKDIVWM